MSALVFAFLVLLVVALGALLGDDPPARRDQIRRLNGHEPPRSHPADEFSRTGSSWH